MPINRVLLFYISVNSGHQMAAMAIEDTIHILDRNIETLNINYFKYTNPVLAKIIMNTYHSMLKKRPELWEYLYDNDKVKQKTAKFRNLLNKFNNIKIKRLMEWYKPDLIVCTQAFPCLAMAEYKRISKCNVPIFAVITDYGVHSYWVDPDVDMYIVPTIEAKERLIVLGIKPEKINVAGIPVSPKFTSPLDNKKLKYKLKIDSGKPVILVMGGSLGMISMDEIVKYLTKLPLDMHLIVICGANKQLYKRLLKMRPKIKFPINIYQYINNVEELMSVSDLIITKPGGLTVTESLIKALPMVIINPIPGQEEKNTNYLLKNNAAVKANDARDVARRVGDIISNPGTLRQIKQNVVRISKPTAAFEIAERIINWDGVNPAPSQYKL